MVKKKFTTLENILFTFGKSARVRGRAKALFDRLAQKPVRRRPGCGEGALPTGFIGKGLAGLQAAWIARWLICSSSSGSGIGRPNR